MRYRSTPILFAVISAVLFGIGTPFAKILVEQLEPIALAGLLYIGAFVGLMAYYLASRIFRRAPAASAPLERKDAPWLAGATISGGIVAPICLMTGLTWITGFSASLLLNLEGLATAIIAFVFFRENLGRRLGIAIACMTAAGILLSWNSDTGAFSITGSLLLAGAGIAWGIDNNLTRHISGKNPVHISQVKSLIAGSTSILIGLLLGFKIPLDESLVFALIVGAVSYGSSLVLFIQALQGLGASRTGAFFSLGPFVGAAVSVVLLNESLGWLMLPAALLMLAGMVAIVYERHSHVHTHEAVKHTHLHSHDDSWHDHLHEPSVRGQHLHEHTHRGGTHDHIHWPDIHHRHDHAEKH